MSIWVFHILLLGGQGGLGGDRGTIDAGENAFYSRLASRRIFMLSGDALDYESFFLGVNQIVPRTNNSQTSDPIPRLFQAFNGHYPNRSSISKLFENIKFRCHFEAPA
jgi:hypothetical protein